MSASLENSQTTKRVILVKEVARKWLKANVKKEYRLNVYQTSFGTIKRLPSLLKGLRDGKLKLSEVEDLKDLGIKEEYDFISLWSSNYSGLKSLERWLSDRGVETSGFW